MPKNMKTRKAKDGFNYPYTSPDLVIDPSGKSVTTKFNELEDKMKKVGSISIDDTNTTTDKTWSSSKIDSQFKDIAKEVGTETLKTTAQDVKGAINEVFQNVSNGKQLIATAITGKGIKTSSDDTFQVMATNIGKINTGIDIEGKIITVNNTKYELSTDAEGNIIATIVKHTVTNNLSNVTNNNISLEVNDNSTYKATLIAAEGYSIDEVHISMGGVDITANSYSNGNITISNVTGDIVITVTTIIQTKVRNLSFSTVNNSNLNDRQMSLVYVVNDRDVTNGYSPSKYLYIAKTTTGWCYMTSTAPDETPTYLCDWNSLVCFGEKTDPRYYSHVMTKEGDIVVVFKGESIATGTTVIDKCRQNPIVYPHNDYNNPVKVKFSESTVDTTSRTGTKQLQPVTGFTINSDCNSIVTSSSDSIYIVPVSVGESIVIKNNGDTLKIAKSNTFKIGRLNGASVTKVTDVLSPEYTYTNTSTYTEFLYLSLHTSSSTLNATVEYSIPSSDTNILSFSVIPQLNLSWQGVGLSSVASKVSGVATVECEVIGGKSITINKSGGGRCRIIWSNQRITNYNNAGMSSYSYSNNNDDTSCSFTPTEDGWAYIIVDYGNTGDCTINGAQIVGTDTTESIKPTGWLQNCGVEIFDGYIIFGEYTRPSTGLYSHVWKVSSPYTDKSNWKIVKSFEISREPQGNLKHCHSVSYDIYGDVIYLATGDYNDGAMIWYSKDKGISWIQLGSGEKQCRLLNFIFTQDAIYWCSDSGAEGKHGIFKGTRNGNGVMDFANITELAPYPSTEGQQATYATVYLKTLNMLVFLDRFDGGAYEMPIYYYNLAEDKLGTLGFITPVGGRATTYGFRCSAVSWYATSDNKIATGFGTKEYTCFINVLDNSGGETSRLHYLLLKVGMGNEYKVTNNLTNCTTSNTASDVIENSAYTEVLTATTGTLKTPTISMGGVDITSKAWISAYNRVTISNVTGDVIISCSAS